MGMFQAVFALTALLFVCGVRGQSSSCRYQSESQPPPGSWGLLENFSSGKCLRVDNFGHFGNSQLRLNNCLYKSRPERDQKIYFERSSLGSGYNLKVDAGLNEKYCLTTKNGVLKSADCRSQSFDQTWTLKPVRGQKNHYLFEKYSSRQCLIPSHLRQGAPIELKPCNSLETEQIWKVCLST